MISGLNLSNLSHNSGKKPARNRDIGIIVGDIKSRMYLNTGNAYPTRNSASFYFPSKYTLGGVNYRGVISFAFNKNMAKNCGIAGRLYSCTDASLTDSTTFTYNTASYGDENVPVDIYGYMGGNHSFAYTSAMKITYNDVIASQVSEANSPIIFDTNYIAAVNAKLFDLIGKDGVSITIGGTTTPIVVIAVLPTFWNYTTAQGRLKNVQILFLKGHGTSSTSDWKYTKITSGTIASVNQDGTPLDLSLAHSGGGDTRTVASMAIATITQTEIAAFYGTGFLDWFYPVHLLTTRILSQSLKDSDGFNLLDGINARAASNNYTGLRNYIEYNTVYQVHNIYDLVEYIKAHRPYTFDPVAFNANRDYGYYGNPMFNQINVPVFDCTERYRYRGYNLLDIKQSTRFYLSISFGSKAAMQTVSMYQTELPAGDPNATKKFQVYAYLPGTKAYDKILPLNHAGMGVNIISSHLYAGKTNSSFIQLSPEPKTDSAARADKAMFFHAAFMNTAEEETSDANRLNNCTVFNSLTWRSTTGDIKAYTYSTDKKTVIDAYIAQGKPVVERICKQTLPTGSLSDISKQATAVYWGYGADGSIYLRIDFHRDVVNSKIQLPVEFANRAYTIYQTYNGLVIDGSSPERTIAITLNTSIAGQIDSDAKLLMDVSGTGDTAYASPVSDTVYDLSGTELDAYGAVPVAGIPNGNLAQIILKISGLASTTDKLTDIPVAIAGEALSDTEILCNWNAVTGADSYRFDLSKYANFAAIDDDYNDLTVGLGTSKICVGLSADTTYYYRVRSVIGGVVSLNSNIISVTTLPAE